MIGEVRLLFSSLAVLVLVAIPVAAAERPTAAFDRSAAVQPSLTRLRVCPYELFSRALQRCTRDARRAPLSTNRFTCSASVDVDRATTLQFRVTYDGGPVTGWRRLRAYPGVSPVWFSYSIGTNLPLPAGAWSCSFLLGSVRATIPFSTQGPTGDVVDLTVCAAPAVGSQRLSGRCGPGSSRRARRASPRAGTHVASLWTARWRSRGTSRSTGRGWAVLGSKQ
jgi:hypothetical protein